MEILLITVLAVVWLVCAVLTGFTIFVMEMGSRGHFLGPMFIPVLFIGIIFSPIVVAALIVLRLATRMGLTLGNTNKDQSHE